MDLDKDRPYFLHFIIELESSFEESNSLDWIKEHISLFIKKLEVKTLKEVYHLFKPQGISLVNIISSSHIAVHTWPENNYIHIDFLTCSKNVSKTQINEAIKLVYPGKTYKLVQISY